MARGEWGGGGGMGGGGGRECNSMSWQCGVRSQSVSNTAALDLSCCNVKEYLLSVYTYQEPEAHNTQNNRVDKSVQNETELKCGLCEHHLKCQNNHQHDCGHSRKEEEEELHKLYVHITTVDVKSFSSLPTYTRILVVELLRWPHQTLQHFFFSSVFFLASDVLWWLSVSVVWFSDCWAVWFITAWARWT